MNRLDPNRRPLLLCVAALLVGSALAASNHQRILARAQTATPSPYALAGRFERSSPPGGYVDVHGPFDAAEEVLLRHARSSASGHPVAGPSAGR